MTQIEQVLINRDGLTREEAAAQLAEMRDELYTSAISYEDMEDILAEEGLEPDYFDDLI